MPVCYLFIPARAEQALIQDRSIGWSILLLCDERHAVLATALALLQAIQTGASLDP